MNKFIYLILLVIFFEIYADEQDSLKLQFKRLQEDVEYLTKDDISKGVVDFEYKLNKKLQDGYILYLLGEYSNAAIVFYDIISRNDFKNEIAYEEAIFYLAESLKHLGNYLGAKDYYNRILKSSSSKFKKQAYQELLEISYKLKDQKSMENLTAKEGKFSKVIGDNIYYRKAKIYYYQEKYDKAINEFFRIKKDSEYYNKAIYFIATIYVIKANLIEKNYNHLLIEDKDKKRIKKDYIIKLNFCNDKLKDLNEELLKLRNSYEQDKKEYYSKPKKIRKRWKYSSKWIKVKKEHLSFIEESEKKYNSKKEDCDKTEEYIKNIDLELNKISKKRIKANSIYENRNDLYMSAIKLFKRIINSNEDSVIKDNAIMSVARLYYTIDEINKSIDMYQRIGRNSSLFARSLYELSWTYARGGFYQKALYSIDLLVDILPLSNIIPEALLLKAYLYNRMDLSDEAIVAYQNVKDRYHLLSLELKKISDKHPNLIEYFKSLISKNLDEFNLLSIIPKKSINFIESNKDVLKVKSILSSLNQATQHIKESKDLLAVLLDRLNENNLFVLFPKTKETVNNSFVTLNKLLILEYNLNSLLFTHLDIKNKDKEELEKNWQKFNKLIKKHSGFENQKKVYEISNLEKRIHALGTYLEQMNSKIMAIRNILNNDNRYDNKEKAYFEKKLEEKVNFINNNKNKLHALKVELLKHEKKGSSNFDTFRLRKNIYNNLKNIRDNFNQKKLDVYKDVYKLSEKIIIQRKKILKFVLNIKNNLSNKLNLLKKDIMLEKLNISNYEVDLKNKYEDLINLYARINFKNFHYLNNKFYNLMLNSEIGILEVAWKDKENLSKKIQDYYQDKKNKIDILDSEFKEILGDSQ